MREIEFRGKRVDNGEWVYGYYFEDTGALSVIQEPRTPNTYTVIPATVGQYTGLKDKNGVDIYEGDICVRTPFGLPMQKAAFTIHYHVNHCAYVIADIDGRVKTWLHEITHTHDIEVIGNRWENPELLEDRHEI